MAFRLDAGAMTARVVWPAIAGHRLPRRRSMPTTKRFLAAILLAFAAVTSAAAQDKLKVVASFSIVADLVKQVGGDHVEVSALVGPNTDMHDFRPTPADSRRLLGAQLVVINGLGFEGWADRLVKAAGYRGARLVASKGVKALPGRGHGRTDPHAWQEVANVKIYVANIRDALSAADPKNESEYRRRAADYIKQLDALEAEIKVAFEGIPKPRRVVTSHEAFSYYGDAYDIEFLAPRGISEHAQPSAKTVAQLIRQIKREKVKAVFVETISDQRLMDQIARETGAVVGGTLYSDALSDASGPAASYIAMMRHNTRLLAAALGGQRP
jgi:zinc/manganese transport system substrate-binding protein